MRSLANRATKRQDAILFDTNSSFSFTLVKHLESNLASFNSMFGPDPFKSHLKGIWMCPKMGYTFRIFPNGHLLGKLLIHHQIWWYPYFQTMPDRVGTDIFAAKISNYVMVYGPSDSVYT